MSRYFKVSFIVAIILFSCIFIMRSSNISWDIIGSIIMYLHLACMLFIVIYNKYIDKFIEKQDTGLGTVSPEYIQVVLIFNPFASIRIASYLLYVIIINFIRRNKSKQNNLMMIKK